MPIETFGHTAMDLNPLLQHKITRANIGFYRVGDVCYQNKIQALMNCPENVVPQWSFLDEEFGLVNWLIEPNEDLYELYKQRAWQLRNTYDRLILMLSGGIDSITVLRTFIDNKIPLDGIVTYGSFSAPQWQSAVKNSEQIRITLPLIRQLQNQQLLPCEHYLLDDFSLYNKFEDESWIYSTGNGQMSPEAFIFNFHWQDPYFQKHLMAGNTAVIRGVDKPKIIIRNGEWQLLFVDATTFGSFPAGIDPKTNHYYGTEYFYWTPDLPKMLVKQCHVVRRFIEQQMFKDPESHHYWQDLFSITSQRSSREYAQWIDPLIYGRYLDQQPGQTRNYFSVGKPANVMAWSKDDVFFKYISCEKQSIWRSGIEFAHDKIEKRFFNQTSDDRSQSLDLFIKHGFKGIVSKAHVFAKWSVDTTIPANHP